MPIEIVKSNECILGQFAELFKITNSSYVYYPSHFSPINIKSVQHFESLSMLDYIAREQHIMLNNLVKVVFDNLGTLHKLSN